MFENALRGKSKDIEEDNTVEEFGSLSINSWFNDGLDYVEQEINIEIVDDIEYSDGNNDNKCSVEEDFTGHFVNTEENETKELNLRVIKTNEDVEKEPDIEEPLHKELVETELIVHVEPVENGIVVDKPVSTEESILVEPLIGVAEQLVVISAEVTDEQVSEPDVAPIRGSKEDTISETISMGIGINELVENTVSTNEIKLKSIDETGVELALNEPIDGLESEENEPKEEVIKQKTNKSLKLYECMCVVFVALTVFFGISYVSWSLDNSNTHGVVSGLISETTSKHNMTVTADNVIDDVQIGEVFDFLEVDFEPLIQRNNDVNGYLKVKALEGLEYPVMQTMDNEFYLDSDIDKKKSGAGWLFVDCRNNLDYMQFNTIIYGHNRIDGLMFGNLKQLLKVNLASEPDADKIYFNTRTNQMIYEICSVYVTTFDDWEYYDVDFSEKQKENFITRLNKLNQAPAFARSDLSTMDTFLTLSTCHGSAGTEKRLVVHARLVAIK